MKSKKVGDEINEFAEELDLTLSEPRAGLNELWSALRPIRKVIVVGGVLAVVGAAVGLAQPLAMIQVINAAGSGSPLSRPLMLLAGLFVLDGLLIGFQSYILLRGAESFALSLRRRLVGRIMFWRLRTHEKFRSGDLLSRVTNDVSSLRAVVSEGTVDLFGASVSLIGAVALMIYIDAVLFFISVSVLLLAAVLVIGFTVKVKSATEKAQHEVGQISADLDRALSGIRTVIAADTQSAEYERISGRADAAFEAGRRAAAWDALVAPVLLTGANAAFLVIFGVGGVRVANGSIDFSVFISFVLYFAVLVTPLIISFQALSTIQRALGALKRVQEVLETPMVVGPESREEISGVDQGRYPLLVKSDAKYNMPDFLPDRPLSVRLDDVVFSYGDGRPPVFSELTLSIRAGAITAIVAPSGFGKTTLLSLLLKFYDADAGAIHYNGVSLTRISESDLRTAIAYVPQDPPMFFGTLRDNLLYGVQDFDEHELEAIVERLGLQHLAIDLPDGLNTHIGDRGSLLSGGERQRIALVRAVLRKPKMLVLDEPTSQIDDANEVKLISELLKIRENCTVVLTSHRKSTVNAADSILDLSAARPLHFS